MRVMKYVTEMFSKNYCRFPYGKREKLKINKYDLLDAYRVNLFACVVAHQRRSRHMLHATNIFANEKWKYVEMQW